MISASYKTKKALKESKGKHLRFHEPWHPGPSEYKEDGTFPVVGPSEYQRNWYALVTLKDGIISKVT